MNTMLDILNEAKEVAPVTNINGKDAYTFEDSVKLSTAELLERQAMGEPVEFGEREVSVDGLSYLSSNIKYVSIDPEKHYINRYRKVTKSGKDTYEVVIDYRAINEQAQGIVYTNNVTVYVIAKSGKDLVLDGIKTVSADEFINGFKNKLDIKSMKLIMDVIGKQQTNDIAADKLEL